MSSDALRLARAVTYCSFANEGTCLGVCILNGSLGPVEASRMAHSLSINPGGELLVVACQETDEDIPLKIFEAMWENRDRLIPVSEARILFEAKSIREFEQEVT